MKTDPPNRFSRTLQRKYIFALLAWSLLLAVSLAWNAYQEKQATLNAAIATARANINKDIGFRKWVASHGGVYVTPSESTPPNPYLKVPNRDVVTTTGEALTLMNPAYALREMQNNFGNEYGNRSHITSLKPLNPSNAGDAWETGAMKRFEQGGKEVVELQQIDGQPYVRMMRPFVVEPDCLKCHAQQGYKVGDIRGGISTSVSLTAYLADERKRNTALTLSHGLIWLIGLLGGMVSYRHERSFDDERNQIEATLLKSEVRFRNMFENNASVMLLIEPESGAIVGANAAAARFYGYPVERLQTMAIDQINTLSPAEVAAERDRAVRAERNFFIFSHRLASGEIRSVEVRSTPINMGESVLLFSIINDISERKQAELQLLERELQYRTLADSGQALIWTSGTDKLCDYFNKVWLEFTGRSMEQEMGNGWAEGVHPDDFQHCLDVYVSAFDRREKFSMDYRLRHRDGEYRWIQDDGCPRYDRNGEFIGYIGYCLDITERKQAELKAAALIHRYQVLMQSTSEGIHILDDQGNVIEVNDAFCRHLGYTEAEALQLSVFDFDAQLTADELRATIKKMLADQAVFETVHRRKDGTLVDVEITVSGVELDGQKCLFALGRDITQKKETAQIIWKQANFDTLTGLPNRHMFHDRLEQELKKNQRTKLPLALMLIDLDHFKEVNDTLGHDMGDVLLVEAARRINECVRNTDTVARLGGDEFVVILPELDDISSAERIAQGIVQKISAPYQLKKESGYVSASIGITLCPNDADTIDELLKNADQAMYAAKNRGRNCHNFFTSTMQENVQTRQRLVNDLRGALAANQFMVYFQPIVELETGNINKVEALIRWKHPERGLVSPAEFIPLAEETGLIFEIGDWVFHESMRWAKRWRAMYNPLLQISVNKSPLQFYKDGDEHSEWLAHLHKLDLPGQCIAIEITEGLLLDLNTPIAEALLTLRNSDIQVSIDDFGTGYSSLSYLKKFHIDYLKIDQSFVRDMATDPSDLALSEAIIVMAHKLGIKVIAEGVETVEQRDLLAAAGCDYAQGYLYSRPIPAEEFEALLKQW